MAEMFNLNQALENQHAYAQRKFTGGENGLAAMEQRELQKAQQAIEAQQGFLSLTLKEKIQELVVSDRVLQEFSDVAVKTLTGAVQPFLDWLKEYEVYYTENLFTEAIQSDAKQLTYTAYALSDEASKEQLGQNFYAAF